MIDLILYDAKWRLRFVYAVRGCVYFFIVSLMLLGFTVSLDQLRTYATGRYNEYIAVYGEVKLEEIKALKKELLKIPDWLMDDFISIGGKVVLSSTPMRDVKKQDKHNDDRYLTLGFFRVNGDTSVEIWVHCSAQAIEGALLHEFGHYLDRARGCVSDSDDFMSVFETEKNRFLEIEKNEYHISSTGEFFAECFELYLNNPRRLRKQCPQAFVFMDSLVSA